MKTALFSLLILGAMLLSSCEGSKPESCFIVQNKSSLSVGDNLDLSNCSLNAETYSWDFGDGNTTEKFIPTHSYSTAGDYTITLTVTKSGKSDSSSEIISVSP